MLRRTSRYWFVTCSIFMFRNQMWGFQVVWCVETINVQLWFHSETPCVQKSDLLNDVCLPYRPILIKFVTCAYFGNISELFVKCFVNSKFESTINDGMWILNWWEQKTISKSVKQFLNYIIFCCWKIENVYFSYNLQNFQWQNIFYQQ